MPRKEASRNTILPKTLKDLRSTKEILIPAPDNAKTTDQSSPDDLLWKEEDPSMKYILSHKFNQAGAGWIGFKNCQGFRTVFIKIVKATRQQKLQFHKTDQVNLINLQEVFHSKNVTYLIYDFDRCDLPLSMVHASPNVQFTEADIAIVCRQVLTGLQYIHEKLKISHGSIKLSDLVLSQSGEVKIGMVPNWLRMMRS
jgi:serine/threonine protein kinase